ncbi:DEAD-domain-containing protein [Dendrothele bispora CBS 962.96]|uniref:RNA helicase n=1 Tax=Dendrothele bispora (strain CBS 962.96) TaxID=1314807 RepID=A0A4S8LYG2_DENBC|nr:DEAD-domain-containing protein [Dendrothele bispora CBS 962.96]
MLRGASSSKRNAPSLQSTSKKKIKIHHHDANSLPWKHVSRPMEAGMDGDDGILDLEEVENVEVFYEETEHGRIPRFRILESESKKTQGLGEVNANADKASAELQSVESEEEEEEEEEELPEDSFDSEKLLPEWHPFSLHTQLYKALHKNNFSSPTPIQAVAVPIALKQRDVVGVAQTGSGKTLAYGLPILHKLLSDAPRKTLKKRRPLRALILAPTRELALQVSSHLNTCLNDFASTSDKGNEKDEGKPKSKGPPSKKPPPKVSVAAVVGGMSAQKQKRILDRGVDVLVATPGRLWDVIENDDTLAREIKQLRFLVLDEADRMIEAGHFAELDNILRLTLRESECDGPDVPLVEDPDQEDTEDTKEAVAKDQLQTFVFSATLSKDLQRNVKRRSRPKKSKKRDDKPATTLDDLLLRLDFRDPEPEVIDLSPQGGVVSTLTESKIECLSADKDVYLYYFLLRYPGRSLVFLSSIDGIRRLMPLLDLLTIKAFPLHSQLEQRQRLKNLDRFKSTPNSVLLATDIAARGLDIPSVDHVIHYQIPRSADVYVHRNGRTARAMRKGFSMLMCAPDERKMVRALMGTLSRQEDEIQEISIDLGMLDKLKARVQLARKIETAHHKVKKENHEKNWMKKTAEAMEIELDSDFASESDDDRPTKRQRKAKDVQNNAMKVELKKMLAQPLVAKGVSVRYITSGNNSIVDNLLAGDYNDKMLGVGKNDAEHDVVHAKKKKKVQSVKTEDK